MRALTRDDLILIALLLIVAGCCLWIGWTLAPDAVEVIRWRYMPRLDNFYAGTGYWRYVGAC